MATNNGQDMLKSPGTGEVNISLSERAALVVFQLLNSSQVGGAIVEEVVEAKQAFASALRLVRQPDGSYARATGAGVQG